MTMFDRLLHATRRSGDRGVCTMARTAQDDLRDLGFPAGGGRTAVEDTEEDAAETETKEALTEDETLEEEDTTTSKRQSADDEDLESEDTDETDPSYKKRFVGSQKSYLELKKKNEELEARFTRLEQSTRTQPVKVEPTNARDETATRLAADLDQIPNDTNARKATIQKWVGTIEQTSEQTARRVLNEAEMQRQGYETAKTNMKAALQEKGLDPEVFFPFADAKAAELKRTNRAWFDQIPVDKQYGAIADLLIADRKAMVGQDTKRANEALRDKANGVVGKANKSVTKAKSGEKDDVPDRSFTQQQNDVRALRHKDGAARFASR